MVSLCTRRGHRGFCLEQASGLLRKQVHLAKIVVRREWNLLLVCTLSRSSLSTGRV